MIRQGTIEEMQTLWYKKNTSEFFAENICNGNAEFWTIEKDEELIGELYLFKSLDDNLFADGRTLVYLCAFRISKNHRGKGYGTMLMNRVFDRLKELEFKYVTIGVEIEDANNMRLYQKLGFLTDVGSLKFDPCDVDEKYLPIACKKFMLLKKTLI